MEKLPVELALHVFSFVDIQDIPNLRLVNRSFAAVVGRDYLSHGVTIDIAGGGLRKLSDLSEMSQRRLTRSLEVFAIYPNGPLPQEPANVYQWRDGFQFHSFMLMPREIRALRCFVETLPRFPHLEQIILAGDALTLPMNCDYSVGTPRRGLRFRREPGWRSRADCYDDVDFKVRFGARYLMIILIALAKTQIRLATLRVQWISWLFFDWDESELRVLLSPLATLHHLFIGIINDDLLSLRNPRHHHPQHQHQHWRYYPPIIDPDEYPEAAEVLNCARFLSNGLLARLLSNMTELRTLHLTFSRKSDDPNPISGDCVVALAAVMPPREFTWRHLRSLKLSNICASRGGLADALARHAATLRELYLEDVDLSDGCWARLLADARGRLALRDADFNGILTGWWHQDGRKMKKEKKEDANRLYAQRWNLYKDRHLRDALRRYFVAPAGGGPCPLNRDNDSMEKVRRMNREALRRRKHPTWWRISTLLNVAGPSRRWMGVSS
ncbi:hypothetical protein F5Y14DRAFT_118003 [Nemania sp. NC0429]|nr:hypothetical protein F5Y14DRAFT_118003 [Nemania sp. NC0429]